MRQPFVSSAKFYLPIKRVFIFGSGSGLGAIIDYVFTLLLHETLGLDASLALALTMIVSSAVVFIYHEKFTFGTSGPGRFGRYARFLLLTAVVLALRVLSLRLLTYSGVPVFLAVGIAIAVVSIGNFIASSLLVFRKPSK